MKHSIIRIRAIAASACLLFLGACSTTQLYILNSALKIKADHTVLKDIFFGSEAWQKLDVHIPNAKSDKDKPVLIFFYGGSWDSGKKEMYFFAADAFTRLGYVVVIPDYLKYPEARFPDFMYDGAAAVTWVKNNIAQYGGDPNTVFIAGHSAGAHLGSLLLTDERYLKKHDLSPLDIRGFSGLAGPYNFTPKRSTLKIIFGPEENYPNMQASNFVTGNEPPMLLLHGEQDTTVGAFNQEILITALNEAGNPSIGTLYPKLTHISILMSLTPLLRKNSTTIDDMDEFFKGLIKISQNKVQF